MVIHNYMEDIVKSVSQDMLSRRTDVCKCEQCVLDITAWTLNRLPCKYVVTRKGRVYTKLQEMNLQFKADVAKEIAKAIAYIKDRPRH